MKNTKGPHRETVRQSSLILATEWAWDVLDGAIYPCSIVAQGHPWAQQQGLKNLAQINHLGSLPLNWIIWHNALFLNESTKIATRQTRFTWTGLIVTDGICAHWMEGQRLCRFIQQSYLHITNDILQLMSPLWETCTWKQYYKEVHWRSWLIIWFIYL